MRKYKHWESFVTHECFLPEHSKMVRQACDSLAWLLDLSHTISIDSTGHATSEHPAFRAIVAMGEPALPWLLGRLSRRWDETDGWWEIRAVQGILQGLDEEVAIPPRISGRIRELRGFFRKHLKGMLAPDGRVKFYAKTQPIKPICKCGKPGKWIADGISRFGFYCERCSKKALDNA